MTLCPHDWPPSPPSESWWPTRQCRRCGALAVSGLGGECVPALVERCRAAEASVAELTRRLAITTETADWRLAALEACEAERDAAEARVVAAIGAWLRDVAAANAHAPGSQTLAHCLGIAASIEQGEWHCYLEPPKGEEG